MFKIRTLNNIAVAYEAASRISFDGMQLRRDIGQKALAALRS